MKSLSLVFIWMVLAVTCVFAQTEVNKSEKTVNVSVEKNDDGQREVAIKINQDGKVKEIKWEDDGEMPDEIRKMLAEEDIDISMLEGDNEEVQVRVRARESDDSNMDVKKRVIIKKDGDGDTEVLEWDGEGEMPEDIKMLLEEHDIDIDEITEEAIREKRAANRGEMRKRHRVRKHKAMADGEKMNKEEVIEYEIIKEGGDVMKWKSKDGEEIHIEGDHDVLMFDSLGSRKGKNVFIFEDAGGSNAYMGAQIESSDDGVTLTELLKDSPADQAGLQKGDVVKMINGARIKRVDALLNLLNYFEPGDTVDVSVMRGGAEKVIKLTLGERPGAFR